MTNEQLTEGVHRLALLAEMLPGPLGIIAGKGLELTADVIRASESPDHAHELLTLLREKLREALAEELQKTLDESERK